MFILPLCAAVGASTGWAVGIVLAQAPARALGAFEFTRIQLIVCAALLAVICTVFGLWHSVAWAYWPAFVVSICFGIILGNLAMIECLRRGGPRRTELLLTFKGVFVMIMAYLWLGEAIEYSDLLGAAVVLCGVFLAIQYGSDEVGETDHLTGSIMSVIVLGLVATACQGMGFLIMKPAMQAGTEPLAASAIRLLGAALIISVVGLWPAQIFRPQAEMTPQLVCQTIVPGVIGYAVSSSLLLYAFAHYHAGVVAVLGSLSPVLVLFVIWIKEGTPPGILAMLGATLAVLGMGIIVIA
ncbi:DMT family transporter [Roseovarius sp. EL26]|uniref:DMT family transporter n=1 Tax=Roseovarius sp. EL26 TaxID=2126672 RepID=UPI000EA28D75|nr:DMT family transporter [Roseovarius sp. EL26]